MVSAMRWYVATLGVWLGACSAGSPAATPVADAAARGRDANARTADASVPVDAGPGADAAPDALSRPCSTPPGRRPDGSTCVLEAEGFVEDLDGHPLADLVMTFCGSVCFGGRSRDDGHYALPVGLFLDTQDYAIHADGRPNHAVDYRRLQAEEPRVIATTMQLPTLPPSTVALPPDGAPASSVTVGDLTFEVAAGTKFDLDIEDYGTAAGRILRVAAVPLASAPPYATAARVEAIYALAPSSATSSIKMGVLLKNRAAIPASAAVDVMVLGDDYFSSPPDVGLLEVVASAHVSADGLTIQTDPGEGITKITWLAVRRKGT
jgi:hypothetical protein